MWNFIIQIRKLKISHYGSLQNYFITWSFIWILTKNLLTCWELILDTTLENPPPYPRVPSHIFFLHPLQDPCPSRKEAQFSLPSPLFEVFSPENFIFFPSPESECIKGDTKCKWLEILTRVLQVHNKC